MPEQKNRTVTERLSPYRAYLRKRPVMLGLLSMLTVAFFVTVTAASRAYHTQRNAIGDRWFSRGVADLDAKRFDPAVTEFRSALLYSRDDYSYQLNLAEALIGLGRTAQASAYLLNLWDREPENGLVNLELARIASQQGQNEQAVRYYHNAVYATWQGDEKAQRTNARFELIELLLHTHDQAQARAELIALAENVGDDPVLQERIGSLSLRAQDYDHALTAYRLALHSDRRSPGAMAAAGEAAFVSGRYSVAQRYLQAAVGADPNDSQSKERLQTAEMVLHMDPFRQHISASDRNRIVMGAFATAGQRLKDCPVLVTPGSGPSLSDSWAQMKPQISQVALRRNPDLSDSAMDLVFRIERRTNDQCGTPSGQDLALLLIAKLHEGS